VVFGVELVALAIFLLYRRRKGRGGDAATRGGDGGTGAQRAGYADAPEVRTADQEVLGASELAAAEKNMPVNWRREEERGRERSRRWRSMVRVLVSWRVRLRSWM
jgi:hypothetical protein